MRLLTLLAIVLLGAASLSAQNSPTPSRVGAFEDSARAVLAARWDDTNPKQPERAFCASFAVDTFPMALRYRVTRVDSALTRNADPYEVTFACPEGTVRGHVHTPTTCQRELMRGVLLDTCVLGGYDAYVCDPSPDDRLLLLADGHPFALLQCDRNAVLFLFPPQKKKKKQRRTN